MMGCCGVLLRCCGVIAEAFMSCVAGVLLECCWSVAKRILKLYVLIGVIPWPGEKYLSSC